ncbi:hypothetical protein D3C87_269850 [compost metagenome]
MKVLLNSLLFIVGVVLLNACSKEKRVEKWLKNGAGEWEVIAHNVKVYENDTLQSDDNLVYPLKFIFDENGNFLKVGYTDADQTIVNAMDVVSGKWTSTKDEIVIESGDDPLTMKILGIDRKKMKLESTETYGSIKYISTYSLEKDK